MLFIVELSHVIATSAACIQVSFQQIQLRLCSKCPPLALTHAQNLVKVICFSQGTVATFTGEVDTFIIILCDLPSGFCTPKITLFKKINVSSLFLKQGV